MFLRTYVWLYDVYIAGRFHKIEMVAGTYVRSIDITIFSSHLSTSKFPLKS